MKKSHVPALLPKVLRYLAAVAQTGSVQAAAREVSISASAIDRQILLLEDELGVPLFERQPRGMRLTAAGEMVLALSQRWRSDLSRTISEVLQLQGVHRGQVRVVAMDSHVNGFLPEFVRDVGAQHPGIVLEVDIASPDEASAMLQAGEADVAVVFNLRQQRSLNQVWGAELPLGCAVAPDHPLARQTEASFQDVAAWPLAVQSRALAIRRYLERRHPWLLHDARPPLVTNSLQLLKQLVCGGTHVALTSELDVGPELLAGRLRFVRLREHSAQPQTVAVATSATRTLPHVTRIVAEGLAAHVQRHLDLVRAVPVEKKRNKAKPR